MSNRKRKTFYWLFKLLSIVVSCALPVLAIWEKFPVWIYNYGTSRSVGAGAIMIFIIAFLIFRKSVLKFIEDRFKLKYAPPMMIPAVMLIICYTLIYINDFLYDMKTVFWMWFIGCAVGTLLTFIAENRYGNKEEKKDE